MQVQALLHKITKPTAWRGGQILKKEEDAKPLVRCEEKGKEWARHCDADVQDEKNKPWRNEELKKLEEDMPG